MSIKGSHDFLPLPLWARKVRSNRKYTRLLAIMLASAAVFWALVMLSRPNPVVAQSLPDPQVVYREEIQTFPRQFQGFHSTLDRLQTFADFDNPKVYDDPRYQKHGGSPAPKIFLPYPDYESPDYQNKHRGEFTACMGPRGKLLNESMDDQVGVYAGLPTGFPQPQFGSHELIGIDGRISYDRYLRYGPYGLGEKDESVKNWVRPEPVDWENVDWGNLQLECIGHNSDRFGLESLYQESTKPVTPKNADLAPLPRSVVLIRTYTGHEYTENEKQSIRAMITELGLQSGGEYEVVLFVHVKDWDIPLDSDDVLQTLLEENIPREFWGITEFWNVPTVAARYPLLDPGVIDVHYSQWLSVQHFMLDNQQFEYFWNWEIDSRLTGHHYEFTEQVAAFGRKQPRKGIWERNERFYVPEYHGDFDTKFRQLVVTQATPGIWGPMPIADFEGGKVQPMGPWPPVNDEADDQFEWGVGEDADYLGFLPAFNPRFTDWVIRNQVYGYLGEDTPRRATLITHSRLSRRLLMAMDEENLQGRHMGSEIFPVSTALLHGFKGVSVPHPIYSDQKMPGKRADRWFNSGVDGKAGNNRDSPFSWGRESRFEWVSWYYRANLPGLLYWNFLGWQKEGTGGQKYESTHGRHILPSILFHPIKDVHPDADSTHYQFDADLGVEARPDEISL